MIPVPTVKVDCGACRGCCSQIVVLTPNDLQRGPWKIAEGTDLILERRADGGCVYLDGMLGCTVYERRPDMCRMFDCAAWFLMLSPTEFREILITGDPAEKAMVRSGAKHALARVRPKTKERKSQ